MTHPVARIVNLTRQLAIVNAIARTTGAKFASFLYRNTAGELAKHTVIIGVQTSDLYRRDIAAMIELLGEIRNERETGAATWKGLAIETAIGAIADIHRSRMVSLTKGIGNNPAYRCRDAYLTTDVPWIKLHKGSGVFHVSGLKHHKTVIIPGAYGAAGGRLRSPRDQVLAQLPSGRFRQFGTLNVLAARINGETIELDVKL